jgi:broad specificity phosphatase PhoE
MAGTLASEDLERLSERSVMSLAGETRDEIREERPSPTP